MKKRPTSRQKTGQSAVMTGSFISTRSIKAVTLRSGNSRELYSQEIRAAFKSLR
jgi:hypothetical protein